MEISSSPPRSAPNSPPSRDILCAAAVTLALVLPSSSKRHEASFPPESPHTPFTGPLTTPATELPWLSELQAPDAAKLGTHVWPGVPWAAEQSTPVTEPATDPGLGAPEPEKAAAPPTSKPADVAKSFGPLAPANPIAKVAAIPQDETYSPLWFAVALLALAQGVNTIRGIVKSREDFSVPVRRWRNRSRFEAGMDLSSPSLNSHIFEQVTLPSGERATGLTHVVTKKKPKLATMIGNTEAHRAFLAAAELCDQNQEFPSENLGDAAASTMGALRSMFYRGSGRARSPEDLQRVYLRELNKIFRDAYSELYKDGLQIKEREDRIRKHILQAIEVNFPLSEEDKRAFEKVPLVDESYHRIVWLCEVNPKVSRDLILLDITEERFESFRDPNEVESLIKASPNHQQRVRQFASAYRREQEYQRTRGERDEPLLFPRVLAYIDISDKTVPAFIAALLAKYDRKDLHDHLTAVAQSTIHPHNGGAGDSEAK